MNDLIGDYTSFFTDVLGRLKEKGIEIKGYKLSHLGVRASSFEEYERIREGIKKLSKSFAENEHNGRPISKLLLKGPLNLPEGFEVNLIELMPPKPSHPYPPGIEHLGVVIGENLEAFAQEHRDVITGRQDQSPICKPYFITFENEKRVKFYDISLQEVVEREGTEFIAI